MSTPNLEIPKDWTFKDKNVSDNFESHVRESLPWYDMVTGFVAHFARHYIPHQGLVYDIGASTGNIGRAIYDTLLSRHAHFVAIEESKEMALNYEGPDRLVIADALNYRFDPYDFAVCFLVIMFLPISKRHDFIERLIDNLNPGGALIIVDKTEAPKGYLGTTFSRLTMSQKVNSGIESNDIIKKELSLAGYQRPISKNLMKGFTKFFQAGEFSAWILVKNENQRSKNQDQQ